MINESTFLQRTNIPHDEKGKFTQQGNACLKFGQNSNNNN